MAALTHSKCKVMPANPPDHTKAVSQTTLTKTQNTGEKTGGHVESIRDESLKKHWVGEKEQSCKVRQKLKTKKTL